MQLLVVQDGRDIPSCVPLTAPPRAADVWRKPKSERRRVAARGDLGWSQTRRAAGQVTNRTPNRSKIQFWVEWRDPGVSTRSRSWDFAILWLLDLGSPGDRLSSGCPLDVPETRIRNIKTRTSRNGKATQHLFEPFPWKTWSRREIKEPRICQSKGARKKNQSTALSKRNLAISFDEMVTCSNQMHAYPK